MVDCPMLLTSPGQSTGVELCLFADCRVSATPHLETVFKGTLAILAAIVGYVATNKPRTLSQFDLAEIFQEIQLILKPLVNSSTWGELTKFP